MAYTLGNKCAKNFCKRMVLLQLIIENVVTCFFLEHSVHVDAIDVLCAQLTRHLFAIAKFLFETKRYGSISKGLSSPSGGVECAGGMKKIAIFDQYLTMSPKRYKIQP